MKKKYLRNNLLAIAGAKKEDNKVKKSLRLMLVSKTLPTDLYESPPLQIAREVTPDPPEKSPGVIPQFIFPEHFLDPLRIIKENAKENNGRASFLVLDQICQGKTLPKTGPVDNILDIISKKVSFNLKLSSSEDSSVGSGDSGAANSEKSQKISEELPVGNLGTQMSHVYSAERDIFKHSEYFISKPCRKWKGGFRPRKKICKGNFGVTGTNFLDSDTL
jgi:hypothetical protein